MKLKRNQNQNFLAVVNFQDDIHIIPMMVKEISENVADQRHSIHWQKSAARTVLHDNLVNAHEVA